MRLGGPVFLTNPEPGSWIAAVKASGYRAAYCPLTTGADRALIAAFARVARQADIVIAEVGAWSNPLSSNAAERQKALDYCQGQLALADEIGEVCCVNIAGSRGERWDGPDPKNLTAETFDMVVESVRAIIDAVKPTRTYYTLETMPWIVPDSVDAYLEVFRAIDRERFAVHLDPVNLVSSPQRYFANGILIREFVEKLGPWIKSVHAKDILLRETYTTHLDEVRIGLGYLDYRTLLTELNRLPADLPVMLEHLKTEAEYAEAAAAIRAAANAVNVAL